MRWLVIVAAVALTVPATARGEVFGFYPQGGILWQDLYPNNFVDLRPGPGVLDWNCGTQTYDGHGGVDTDIRSFREQAIGVPVFAARDGRVREVQDGFPDENRGGANPGPDNHVVIAHGGDETIYGHLRRGSIGVRVGDAVVAGAQIGLTASSGNSTWPHLHFTTIDDGRVFEPFAGRCRAGASGWAEQAAIPERPYVRDFALSNRPMWGLRDLPWDEAVRTGTFVAGRRWVDFRVELGAAFDARTWRVRIERPDGSVALGAAGRVTWRLYHGRGRARWGYSLPLEPVGRWRLVWELDGTELLVAPFDVVATPAEVVNRAPVAVAADVAARAGDAAVCRTRTSLVREDPDYDIVRYRYRWTVAGAVVREVETAALSDVLRRDALSAGDVVACSVTPSDGRAAGPEAVASQTAR